MEGMKLFFLIASITEDHKDNNDQDYLRREGIGLDKLYQHSFENNR